MDLIPCGSAVPVLPLWWIYPSEKNQGHVGSAWLWCIQAHLMVYWSWMERFSAWSQMSTNVNYVIVAIKLNCVVVEIHLCHYAVVFKGHFLHGWQMQPSLENMWNCGFHSLTVMSLRLHRRNKQKMNYVSQKIVYLQLILIASSMIEIVGDHNNCSEGHWLSYITLMYISV